MLDSVPGEVIEQQDDDFWDYDKQADLEGFSSKTVYDTLAKQSRDVTQTIGKQKDEVSYLFIATKCSSKFVFNDQTFHRTSAMINIISPIDIYRPN